EAAGLHAVCRCEDAYPAPLRDLADPPAARHIAGAPGPLAPPDPAALAGAPQATGYGLSVAHELGRGLATAGVTVVSGLALGGDSKAHEGSLEARGAPPPPGAAAGPVVAPAPLVAVLAGGAERAYPASKRALHERVCTCGCVVSEMPPGFG